MKKRNLFITIALVIVAATVAFVSCKKEQTPVASNQGKSTLARIKEFKRQLEAVELNPDSRTVTYMSIPDAVWNIEALFNYTYAHPNDAYGQTVCCDTTLNLPVCSNDSVSLVDLNVFNGQMYEAVLTLYQAAVLDNKRFLILDVEAGERNGNLQTIELHTVQGSLIGEQTPPNPPQNGPFENGISWYYGENWGNSQGLYWHKKDAADTLTGMLNHILVPTPPENHEYIYTHVRMKYTRIGGNHYENPCIGFPNVSPRYCEFYKEYPSDSSDYWLNSDQMNFYYFGERHLVLNILPNDTIDPVPSEHSLFQVIVEEYKTEEGSMVSSIGHHTIAYYGHREAVAHDSIHIWDL